MSNSKIYLNVPYAEKDAAKALGARWDPSRKQWYVPADKDITPFSKWQTMATSATTAKKPKSRTSTSNSLQGATTYAKDPDFVAYNGDKPPWD